MSDISPAAWQSLPVLDPERLEYHKATRSFQGHRADDIRRRLRIAWCVAGVSMFANVALSTSVATLLPLHQLVPMPLVIRNDGTVDGGVLLSDLPVTANEAVIRAAVWQYVRERESYSFSAARYRYDLVSVMSSPDVQSEYQHWFLNGSDSPQKLVGKTGQLNVQEISIAFIRDGVAQVRFWRTTQKYGETRNDRRTFTATVEFQLLDNIPETLRLVNPAALQVVRYQLSEDSP